MSYRLPMIRPMRVRLYLLLLQSMFLLLYGLQLTSPLTRIEAGFCLALATLTLLIATIPRLYVETARFIGLVSLANASILFFHFGGEH